MINIEFTYGDTQYRIQINGIAEARFSDVQDINSILLAFSQLHEQASLLKQINGLLDKLDDDEDGLRDLALSQKQIIVDDMARWGLTEKNVNPKGIPIGLSRD